MNEELRVRGLELVRRLAAAEVDVIEAQALFIARSDVVKVLKQQLAELKKTGGAGAADGLQNGAGGDSPPASPVPGTREEKRLAPLPTELPRGFPGELVDAATLPMLTPVQDRVFRALVELRAAKKRSWIPVTDIERKANVRGATYHLTLLAEKGYVKNFGYPGSPEWWPIAAGEPKVGRTCNTVAKPPMMQNETSAKVEKCITPPEPEEPVSLDDLSATAKIVLVHIWGGGATDQKTLRNLRGPAGGYVEYVKLSVQRLVNLHCIEAKDDGGYQCTVLGGIIAAQIKTAAAS